MRLLIAAVGLGTGLAALLFLNEGQWGAALAAHLASGCCGARTLRLGVFGWAMGLGIPALGGTGCALLAAAAHWDNSAEGVGQAYTHYIDASERLGEDLLPQPAAVRPHPESVDSLADVLWSEAPREEKRLAVLALAQLETPQAVEVLRRALGLSDPEVRFYAASVLGRLEERLNLRLQSLEEAIASGRQADAGLHLRVAQSCYDFVYYGLVEGAQRAEVLEKALHHARRGHKAGAGPAAWLLLGRVHLARQEWQRAEAIFSHYIDLVPADQQGFLWRAETRYCMGAFAGLAADCRRARELGVVPRRIEAALALWG